MLEAPNPSNAALAIRACVPDGERVEHNLLLMNAARELGYLNLTREVRRALNIEHNAGRLRPGDGRSNKR
jgi:hypothetical protein